LAERKSLSAPNNPIGGPAELSSQVPQEARQLSLPALAVESVSGNPVLHAPSCTENPSWGVLEIVGLVVFTVLSMVAAIFCISLFVQHYRAPQIPWMDIARWPAVIVSAQVVAYALILGLMYRIAGSSGEPPDTALKWNWPRNWPAFLFAGMLLSIFLQLFAHLLPMPKTLPIDEFFRTPAEAWLLAIFGTTVAPLLEELFFRGFLYPVLARWLGMFVAVLITGVAFGAIHGDQLKYSWGPVALIVVVGIVLTAVRAARKSVASTFLMHVGYNFTLMAAMFIGTDGFRHLEKLRQ
jgi:hypothetical protein